MQTKKTNQRHVKSMSEKEPKNPKTAKPSTAKGVKQVKPAAAKQKSVASAPAKAVPKQESKPAAKPAASSSAAAKTPAKPQAKTEPKKTETKVARDTGKADKPKTTEKKAAKTQKTKKANKERSFGTRVADTFHTVTAKVQGGAAAMAHNKKARAGAIAGLAAILILCLVLGLVLGLRGCSAGNTFTAEAINGYPNVTKVNYSAEILGEVKRTPKTETKSEGAAFGNTSGLYPTYGYTLRDVIGTDADKVAARQAIINESSYLCAFGTAGANRGIPSDVDRAEYIKTKYTCMDKDGYLYYMNDGTDTLIGNGPKTPSVDANGKPRQLYKHTASVGLYLGNVADNEPGIVKRITLMHRTNGYSVTGVYAPAGEVLKVEISGKDMNAEGKVRINIGQALYNNQANNIWASKNQMQRIPHVLTTLEINKYTAEYDKERDVWTGYIGSFVGGPVYVQNTVNTINVTISGGVRYSHFIHGYTTPEEFAENAKSSAPYFDLEVWDCGVLHSGPKTCAAPFSYNDLYKAAVLWEKVSIVTNTNHYKQGIVFIYDPFVAAGAAVAFPGRSSVNCPTGWMAQSLNYNSLTTSGSWGNFHEYHHNFQNYGVGYTGEVTNNGLNLVSYSLFTNISASRQIASYGGAGLSGWNCYTSAPWALNRVNNNQITDTNGLAVYSTLLHNLGADAFIQSRGATGAAYFNKYATNTHQDFSYYAGLVQTYSNVAPSALSSTEYPLFVPVSSVYQTGRTYMYDDVKREINTMQPYVIPYGKPFTVDLRPYKTIIGSNGENTQQYESGSVIIAKDFNYTIKSVNAKGANGTFKETDTKGVYTFNPNSEMRSGKIYVTLEITTKDGAHEWNGHKLDDVDLIIEFQQSKEWNKTVLERTVYNYSADKMYTDAQTAFENNFAGSSSSQTVDHSNPTQNSNTDIWLYPDTEANHTAHPDAPDYYFAGNNRIDVIDGKLYFREDGKYRVYLRGRLNCALYFSIDGNKYNLGATIKKTESFANSDKFATFASDPNTYFDIEFTEGKCTVYVNAGGGNKLEFEHSGDNWLYLKEILIVQTSPAISYIGVGYAQWTVPMYTAEVKYYIGSEDNKTYVTEEVVGGVTKYYSGPANNKTYVDNDLVRSETIYKNSSGQVVSADQANDTTPREPTAASYVTAYRSSYEFKQEFTSDYFYIKEYTFNYTDNVTVPKDQVTVTETNYTPTGWGAGMPIENISDGKTNTYIHTSWKVTEKNPLLLTFDLGDAHKINRIKFFCRNNNGQKESPKVFTVEGSLDGLTWFDVASYTEAPLSGNWVTADFEEATLRYCRVKISQTHQGSYYIVIGEVEFTYATELLGAKQYSPDRDLFKYSGSWKMESGASSFGHVFTGKKGSTVQFEFTGTRLGILTSAAHWNDYEVYIDGKKVDSIALKDETGMTTVSFISPELKEGVHKVEIKCKGDVGFDSVILW